MRRRRPAGGALRRCIGSTGARFGQGQKPQQDRGGRWPRARRVRLRADNGDANKKHFLHRLAGRADRANDEKANGAFVEDVLEVARRRLQFYQECHAPCRENDDAIYHVNAAIDVLVQRRDGRQERGVLGTDKP